MTFAGLFLLTIKLGFNSLKEERWREKMNSKKSGTAIETQAQREELIWKEFKRSLDEIKFGRSSFLMLFLIIWKIIRLEFKLSDSLYLPPD